MGKAIRTPARDAILSHAAKRVGRGFGFGLHEALDQVGAFIGPLIFTIVFLLGGTVMGLLYEVSISYLIAFSVLLEIGAIAVFFRKNMLN